MQFTEFGLLEIAIGLDEYGRCVFNHFDEYGRMKRYDEPGENPNAWVYQRGYEAKYSGGETEVIKYQRGRIADIYQES